jgi:outer membrane immunogenic protein
MRAKGILLASVAGTAAAPAAANAADIPAKAAPKATAAPVVAVAPAWAGLYVGVHAGVAWHKAKADTSGTYYGDQHLADTKAGFIGGGLIGYNLQAGNIIYGLEADISGLSAKAKDANRVSLEGTPVARYNLESDIDWMATLRGRLGVTTGDLLIFVTGGVAWADINNKLTYTDVCCFSGAKMHWSSSKVKTGPVLGGGFDYMFSPNWIGRVEALWADFGKTTVKDFTGSHPTGGQSKTTTFKNSVVVVRGALSYRF